MTDLPFIELFKTHRAILQRFVFLSRDIAQHAEQDKRLPEELLSELKVLIGQSEEMGIHGMAS